MCLSCDSSFIPADIITTVVLICITCMHSITAVVERGHSSLTLYQGITKFELDAKDCPVGVAFNQPELFSCACINGIWAFYSNPCLPPIAIVGGHHHCFPMPPEPISTIVIVSNPLRSLGDSLTVFEGDMNTVKAKFYRNVKMYLSESQSFVSLNSSWTLTSPDGSRSICLEKRDVVFEGLTSEEVSAFPGVTYCSFTNVGKEMPYVGAIKKGCNDDNMVLQAVQCQPMLPQTEEHEVCMNEKLITSYQDLVQKELDPVVVMEMEERRSTSAQSLARLSRALENLGRFSRAKRLFSNASAEVGPVEEDKPEANKYASSYMGEPEWHQRMLAASGGGGGGGEAGNDSNVPSDNSPAGPGKAIDLNNAWNSSETFFSLLGETKESNQLVTNHLWMYYRYAIRNSLNITRLVPPDENMVVHTDTGKVKKLLNVHIGIMKKICQLVPPSFFETVTVTFIALLSKGFRWKEPFVEQTHYLRILASLTTCKDTAEKLNFVPETTCSSKTTNYIVMPDTSGDGNVNVKVNVPDKFQSGSYEPIIEAVWKIFLSVHSYCFKDFSDQYQDHHKYTTLMMGLFSNKIHDIWTRNKTIEVEYAGVLGKIANTMKSVEKCTVGARMKSEYPFHMSRPTKMSKFREESDTSSEKPVEKVKDKSNHKKTKSRRRRSFDDAPRSRSKRLAVNSVNSDALSHSVLGGRGICLRKYSDSKTTVGRHCKRGTLKE